MSEKESCGEKILALDENNNWIGLVMFCTLSKDHKLPHGIFLTKDVAENLFDAEARGSD